MVDLKSILCILYDFFILLKLEGYNDDIIKSIKSNQNLLLVLFLVQKALYANLMLNI